MLLMALNLTQGESCREQGPEWRKGLSSCWGCLRSWGEGTLELGWRAGDRLPQPPFALSRGYREWGCGQRGPERVLRVGLGARAGPGTGEEALGPGKGWRPASHSLSCPLGGRII